tara:strand:+ start:3488 stop:3946 length:459 start_codon:yes stop_codon:yes gene_type:complete
MAKSFREVAESFLKAVRSDVDVYTSVKGKIFSSGLLSYSLDTVSHIQFAAYGRGPGKAPPLEKMLQMVRSKNILFEGLDERGTAFAIQQKIKRKGTSNWKRGAPNLMETTVKKYQLQYENELGYFVSVDINDRLKKEYDKIFKESPLRDFKI